MNESIFFRRSSFLLVATLLFTVFVLVTSFSFYSTALTGHVAAELDLEKPVVGSKLSGTFFYDTKDAGPLPADSTVVVRINTYTKSDSLLNVLSDIEVERYLTLVQFAPLLSVTLGFENLPSSGGDRPPPSDISSAGGISPGSVSQTGGEVPTTNAILGWVALEPDRPVTVQVRAGSDVRVDVPEGKQAVVRSVKKVDGTVVDSSNVFLTRKENNVIVSTSYTEQVRGFSAESVSRIAIELGRFSFTVPNKYAHIEVLVVYNGETLAEAQEFFILSPDTREPSTQEPQLPTDPSSQPSEPLPAPDCSVFVCGEFGSCALPSLEIISQDNEVPLPVQSRQCFYENPACGTTFTDTKECAFSVPLIVLPAVLPPTLQTASPIFRPAVEQPIEGNRLEQGSSYGSQDLAVLGSVVLEIELGERAKILVLGENHFVGLLGLPDEGHALLEVSSTPRQVIFERGETVKFDLDDDGVDDILVHLVSLEKERAIVRVVLLHDVLSIASLSEGDQALTLVKEEIRQPVAHLLLNRKSHTVRIFLVQSYDELPNHCYNNVRDKDENGVDCGGQACYECRAEKANMPLAFSWLALLGGIMALLIFLRRDA